MMTFAFTAKLVETTLSDGDVLAIGFSEDDDTYMNSVIIQYKSVLDEQEEQFGWTKYYLEFPGLNNGAYGCVSAVTLKRQSLKIEMNQEGIEQFGFTSLVISFDISKEKFEKLSADMAKVFSNEEFHDLSGV